MAARFGNILMIFFPLAAESHHLQRGPAAVVTNRELLLVNQDVCDHGLQGDLIARFEPVSRLEVQ
jgi:hypothetical protein